MAVYKPYMSASCPESSLNKTSRGLNQASKGRVIGFLERFMIERDINPREVGSA